MQQIVERWNGLEPQRQLVAALVAMAIVSGLFFMTRIATQPSMALLYSNLGAQEAGEIVTALDANGVAHQIRGNAIYVDATARDQMRLELAGQGLPATGGDGYELLDTLTGFGTTSQMFDAAYLRAKEGELARTILANPQIKAARVHIAKAQPSPFRDTQNPTASVSLRGGGRAIAPETAEAIRYLVSSAVQGMDIKDVAIIDADKGVVIGHAKEQTPESAGQTRAEQLKSNVERLIAARTGFGRAVVEVNVDTSSDAEFLTERLVRPSERVAISTETQETTNNSTNSGGNGVTVASNLPEGDAAGGEQSSSNNSDTREIVNYEVSQTTREVRRDPGSIKRITVAVLVDGAREVAQDGTETYTARSSEELLTLEELVKSAVGFDEARGDQVTIRSMDLPAIAPIDAESGEGSWVSGSPFDFSVLAKLGIIAAAILGLGMFVLRPILASTPAPVQSLPAPGEAPAGLPSPNALTGQIDDGPVPPEMASALPAMDNDMPMMNSDMGFNSDFPDFSSNSFDENPVDRLKTLIEERQDETVEVLRNWIEGTKEPTS